MKHLPVLCALLLALFTLNARALVIIDSPANTTFATPQPTDPYFSLDFDNEIGDQSGANTSTTLPHVTIDAIGNGSLDYFLFEVFNPGDLGIFDIDGGLSAHGFTDTMLALWAINGTLLASNDDAPTRFGATGSILFDWDAFIQFPFDSPGQYVIGVAETGSVAGTGGWLPGANPVDLGDNYRLHISIENHPVPAPGTGLLMLTGLLASALAWRKRANLEFSSKRKQENRYSSSSHQKHEPRCAIGSTKSS